jgi:hypothetical protein
MSLPALSRIRGILTDPNAEFERIAHAPTDVPSLVRRYLVPLALLTPIATVLGMNAFDESWDATHGYRIPKERIFNIGVANFALEILTVLAIGLIFYALMQADRKERNLLQAMNVAVYGAVPLLLSGALLFLPINIAISMVAMLHSFVLYWIGAQKVMHIRRVNASVFVAVSMIVLFGVSTLAGAGLAVMGIL